MQFGRSGTINTKQRIERTVTVSVDKVVAQMSHADNGFLFVPPLSTILEARGESSWKHSSMKIVNTIVQATKCACWICYVYITYLGFSEPA